MKYVIILKTHRDLKRYKGIAGKIQALFPDNYPAECIEKEYDSIIEAVKDYPDKMVMNVEDYNQFMDELAKKYKELIKLVSIDERDPKLKLKKQKAMIKLAKKEQKKFLPKKKSFFSFW